MVAATKSARSLDLSKAVPALFTYAQGIVKAMTGNTALATRRRLRATACRRLQRSGSSNEARIGRPPRVSADFRRYWRDRPATRRGVAPQSRASAYTTRTRAGHFGVWSRIETACAAARRNAQAARGIALAASKGMHWSVGRGRAVAKYMLASFATVGCADITTTVRVRDKSAVFASLPKEYNRVALPAGSGAATAPLDETGRAVTRTESGAIAIPSGAYCGRGAGPILTDDGRITAFGSWGSTRTVDGNLAIAFDYVCARNSHRTVELVTPLDNVLSLRERRAGSSNYAPTIPLDLGVAALGATWLGLAASGEVGRAGGGNWGNIAPASAVLATGLALTGWALYELLRPARIFSVNPRTGLQTELR